MNPLSFCPLYLLVTSILDHDVAIGCESEQYI
uniref:Uncharacterized protein n=1 Tax=Aegilops tauschii subsp. strangulata TaxID=200361 RepID=A0A453GER3_AEGTS